MLKPLVSLLKGWYIAEQPQGLKTKILLELLHGSFCGQVLACCGTFSAVLVQIWAVLDSGAVRRLWSRAMTSAAMLLATWPLMKGRTGSDLREVDASAHLETHKC